MPNQAKFEPANVVVVGLAQQKLKTKNDILQINSINEHTKNQHHIIKTQVCPYNSIYMYTVKIRHEHVRILMHKVVQTEHHNTTVAATN